MIHSQISKTGPRQSGVCFVDTQSNLDAVVLVMRALNDAWNDTISVQYTEGIQ